MESRGIVVFHLLGNGLYGCILAYSNQKTLLSLTPALAFHCLCLLRK